jgi:hypothetical protein
MKALLILRTIAIVVAIASLALSLLTAGPVHDRLRQIGKLAVFGSLGAQLAVEIAHVTGRRAAWTKLLFPLAGLAIAIRSFAAGNLSPATYALLAATDVALMAFAVTVVVRALRRSPETYPEELLEREFDRFTPSALNRYMATELVVMASALRYLCGGFRRPLPPGFSYVRNWSTVPLLLAIPVLTIPEMLVLDFALWHAIWWRTASDIVHAYAMLWFVGIVATTRIRPHRCDGDRVRLRFGCMRRIDLDRSNIAAATLHRSPSGNVAQPKARHIARDVLAMTLEGVPTVELILRQPVRFRSLLGRERIIGRILVAVDEPAAFAAAIAA